MIQNQKPALFLMTTVSGPRKNTQKVGRELEQTESEGQRASATSVNNKGLFRMRLNSRVNQVLGELSFLQERSQKKTFPQRAWWVWRAVPFREASHHGDLGRQ